jgi:hypothetical protein
MTLFPFQYSGSCQKMWVKLRKKYHYLLCTAYLDKVGLHLEKHHSGYPKIKNSQTHKIYKKVENWCF